ncbi:MAG: hypothetical protein ACK46S_01695 [Bacteroidota bacterium]
MNVYRLICAVLGITMLVSFDALAQYQGGFHGGPRFGERIHTNCGPSTQSNIFRGGQADGFSRVEIIQQGCSNTFNNVVFFGGASDGSANAGINPSNCAPLALNFNYFGGNGDGYSRDTLTQQLCPAVFINVNYFGGSNDGYTASGIDQSICTPPPFGFNYQGGNGDGYGRDTLTQQLCPAVFVNVNYFGGQDDGYNSTGINQSICTPPLFGFNYQGGNGDGYARDTLTQQLCPAVFVNVNYFGGVHDGFAKGDIQQNTCAPLLFGFNFKGGNGDGYARDTLTQQLCPGLFVNVNYFGGFHDGFQASSLIQTNCTPPLVGFNYFGGNSDGYFSSTLLQTNCPDLLYYYRSRATGNWNTLSVWEFSTDPNYINPPPAFAITPPAHNNSYEIVVRNTNTVTVNTPVIADDLIINAGGALTLATGANFTLNNGLAATDLLNDGTLNIGADATFQTGASVTNNGLINTTVNTFSSAATITHNNGAIYRHAFDGGTVPTSTWNSGSTLQVTGIVNANTFSGMNQSFHHVEYNSPGQLSSFVDLNGSITAINGNLTVNTTGNNTRELRLFNNTSNTNSSLTVAGDVLINNARLAITGGASSGSANPTLTINGNLTLNGSSVLDMTGNAPTTATGSNVELLGNLTMNSTSTLTRTQSTPSVFRFNKASGIQTYTAAVPNTAISAGAINFEVGNGTTAPEFVLANDFVMHAASSLNVNTAATLDASTRIIRGTTAGSNGAFTLNSGATLKTANINGIDAALNGTVGSVQTGTTKNFSGSATYIYNGVANQITGTGLPFNMTSPGQLTIANTGAVGNNTVTLTTTGTTIPQLNLQSGKFAIGTGNTLNMSNNGNITASAGDFATGTTGGTVNALGAAIFSGNSNPYNVYTSGGVDFGAGTVTIQPGGAFRINAGGSVINNGAFYAAGSTLEYNSGGIYERGLEWNSAAGRGYPHHVSLLNATLNPAQGNNSFAATAFNTAGNVTINTGSSIAMSFGANNMTVPMIINGDLTLSGDLVGSQAVGGDVQLNGNWVNNGTGVNYTPNGRTVALNGIINENIGGTNPTINAFYNLSVNNTLGITLTGANVQINNQLSLLNGKLNLNSRTLTLGVPGFNGILTGGSANAYINSGNIASKFVRYTTTPGTNYTFPMGAGTSYSPVSVNLYAFNTLNNNSNIAVHVVNGTHPNIGTSTTYLNRYWGVEPSGFPSSNVFYGINYEYNDADVVGIEANLKPYKYNNAGWIAAVGSGANFEMGSGTVNPGTNTITWDGLYSFSDFTSIGNGTPLPISLLDFNARPVVDDVELTWTTMSETNNDYFTIERAKDGVNFVPIATVDGAGNSNTTLYYKTLDEEPLEGVSYYRLKQTDFDGRFDYSDIRVVNFVKPGSRTEWAVYPNPTNLHGVNIIADNLKYETVSVRLTDIVGNVILEKGIPAVGNRLNGFLNFGEIAAGVYNLTIVDGKDLRNFKIVVTGGK